MEAGPLPGASGSESTTVDRCQRCGGVFIDYFDGDPSEVARRMARAGLRDDAIAVLERDPVCPDCERPLALRLYLDDGAPIWRCESCAAAFLTPAMLDRLAAYRWTEPAPPGLLSRLLEWWRGVPRDEG